MAINNDSYLIPMKVIILDFDGTIIESVGIKDSAFKTLFSEYPEHLNRIMRYHLSNNATVRFDKFKHVIENILNQEYNEEKKRFLSRRFSDLVFEKIVECPYVRGAEDFLNYFREKVPIYLASASPLEELEEILETRDLKKYFKNVYAIPWIKMDVIQDILKRENIPSEEAVFIGDAFEDYEAARLTDVFFIGRNSGKSFHSADIPVYKNLSDIKEFLLQDDQINEK